MSPVAPHEPVSRPDRDAAAPVASPPAAAPKWLRQPLTKLILAAGSTAVLLLGWFSAPARDVPAPVVVPEDRVAPLLEAEMARRRSLQAFERVQEIGGRVIGYSVAMAAPAEAARRTVGAAELPFESPVLPRAFGVVVSSDGLIVTHAAGLDDGLIEPVLMQNGTTVDAEVLVFEEATGLVLLRVPSGADLPVAPLAVARPASGALATAAGRWPHADIIVPVFVMASTNERYRISGAESL
ncbi:MAG: trypsin-like peptidase domain-containing protein, partial [Vicinamibacterales bacterium]